MLMPLFGIALSQDIVKPDIRYEGSPARRVAIDCRSTSRSPISRKTAGVVALCVSDSVAVPAGPVLRVSALADSRSEPLSSRSEPSIAEPSGRAVRSCAALLPTVRFSGVAVETSGGGVVELLYYGGAFDEPTRQKAETYLAIKHDITISEYVSEAGDTLWDNGDGQTRRIFGMAHDSTLGLYKTACGDVEGLTIEATDSLKAGDYLLCGERSGLPGGRVWRIEREGLAGKTVIVKVGRNRQWREQEPVAILTEERNGITTETQLEAADKDESHYYFSVRFGEGKRSTYEFSLSARDTQSNPSADTPREKSHKSGEGTSPATASDRGGTVELYPNPASDFVVIKGLEGEKKEVEVINAVGLTCKKAVLGENEQSVDIHTLMSGNYIVVVRGGDNEYRVKLIKK